jgi:hypothetical protein
MGNRGGCAMKPSEEMLRPVASNRAVRRRESAKVSHFRRQSGLVLDTAMIAAGTLLDGHGRAEVYRAAIANAYRNPGSLRCMLCARPFATERPFAAFLLSCSAVRPTIASASVICRSCWTDAPGTDVEAAAMRVLRRFVPDGDFLDPCVVQP